MTTKGFPEFLDKMKTDTVFRERILSIGDIDERFAAIRSEGFEFDKEVILDLKESFIQFKGPGIGEVPGWACCLGSGKVVQ